LVALAKRGGGNKSKATDDEGQEQSSYVGRDHDLGSM
jgi:hypothetical protein